MLNYFFEFNFKKLNLAFYSKLVSKSKKSITSKYLIPFWVGGRKRTVHVLPLFLQIAHQILSSDFCVWI